MKINIGCVVDVCGEKGFAEIECGGADESVTGVLLPADWGVGISRMCIGFTQKDTSRDFRSVNFYCPQHNPEVSKAGVVVEEKDRSLRSQDICECGHYRAMHTEANGCVADCGAPPKLCGCEGFVLLVVAHRTGAQRGLPAICLACNSPAPRTGPCPGCGINPDAAGAQRSHEPEIIKPVVDPGELVDLEKPGGHYHPTTIGPTRLARYREEDCRHAHTSPVGLTSWEFQTEEHTHKINITNGNRTGPPQEPDVDFCMASVVDDPTDSGKLADLGIYKQKPELVQEARERVEEAEGEQIGAIYRDGSGVVRIELEPGIGLGPDLIDDMQRAWAQAVGLVERCQREAEEVPDLPRKNPPCNQCIDTEEGCAWAAGKDCVALGDHRHLVLNGSTDSPRHREEDSMHAHNLGPHGLTGWEEATPGHTHRGDDYGVETGPPVPRSGNHRRYY